MHNSATLGAIFLSEITHGRQHSTRHIPRNNDKATAITKLINKDIPKDYPY
jgi:hypothetical protein